MPGAQAPAVHQLGSGAGTGTRHCRVRCRRLTHGPSCHPGLGFGLRIPGRQPRPLCETPAPGGIWSPSRASSHPGRARGVSLFPSTPDCGRLLRTGTRPLSSLHSPAKPLGWATGSRDDPGRRSMGRALGNLHFLLRESGSWSPEVGVTPQLPAPTSAGPQLPPAQAGGGDLSAPRPPPRCCLTSAHPRLA